MVKQPNIILLILDSVRAANLSCYGYHRDTTPNIDSISKEATLFENAISVGCWTLPVHTSLFTGLYPYSHGVTISKDALPEDFPTLARLLKANGYQSASFSNNAYISAVTNLTQGFDTTVDLWRISNPRGVKRTRVWRMIKQLERLGPVGNPGILLLRTMQSWWSVLKRRRSNKDKGAQLSNEQVKVWLEKKWDSEKPFFVFVNFMEPHEPYNPPYPYNRQFVPKRYSSWRVSGVGNNKDVIERLGESKGQEDLEILRALYDGELSYLDSKIGELVQYIEAQGILDSTVIIITSDHGESLGEHNHIGHRMALFEQLIHIPLIIRYPSKFKPGERIRQQVSLIDLYPTILELAGVKTTEGTNNGFHSLTDPPETDARPFVIAENTAPKSLNSVVSRMIRTDRYKYIWRSDDQHELYDLINDPEELVNLVVDKADVAKDMIQYLEDWRYSIENRHIDTGRADYDEAILERLRELGYVD